eukprot:353778-Chlamydomonas_euryale.AAC.8
MAEVDGRPAVWLLYNPKCGSTAPRSVAFPNVALPRPHLGAQASTAPLLPPHKPLSTPPVLGLPPPLYKQLSTPPVPGLRPLSPHKPLSAPPVPGPHPPPSQAAQRPNRAGSATPPPCSQPAQDHTCAGSDS